MLRSLLVVGLAIVFALPAAAQAPRTVIAELATATW